MNNFRDRIDANEQMSSASAAKTFGGFGNVPATENNQAERKSLQISRGIVSGRTAIFENTNSFERKPGKPAVDPAEMSLRDRLALFEKKKDTALIPKAAFGMSVSAKQIASNQNAGKSSDVKKPIISVGRGGRILGGTSHMSSRNATAASKVTGYNRAGMYDTFAHITT